MAHQSFSRTVLDTALQLAARNNGEASAMAISLELSLKPGQEHKRLLHTLSDLALAGRINRVRQGVYAPQPMQKQPDKREVMWRLLRMQRQVTLEYLQEMAGVSKDYAKQWLATLVRRGVVRRDQQPGMKASWRLTTDTVDMPEDDTNAKRLRELRRKKKAAVSVIDDALQQLQTIGETLSKARETITGIEEGI